MSAVAGTRGALLDFSRSPVLRILKAEGRRLRDLYIEARAEAANLTLRGGVFLVENAGLLPVFQSVEMEGGQLVPLSLMVNMAQMSGDRNTALVLDLDTVGMEDIDKMGGKGASLGEMIRALEKKGVEVPRGYGTTAYFYRAFMEETGLQTRIRELMRDLDPRNEASVQRVGRAVREAIMAVNFPPRFADAALAGYRKMQAEYGQDCAVAVRSSATAEDLPDASFAGQQDTYLNKRGEAAVLEHIKKCIASLFTDRAISYRTIKNFDHFAVYLSVVVQRMVESEASGIAFSVDTESGHPGVIVINAVRGLGEYAVGGRVTPDEYQVSIDALREGKHCIVSKKLGSQTVQLVYKKGTGAQGTEEVPVPESLQQSYVLSDTEIVALARQVLAIGDHYGDQRDVEFAVGPLKKGDKVTKRAPQIVQARPVTAKSQSARVLKEYQIKPSAENRVLTEGVAVGEGVGQGRVKLVRIEEGRIVVTLIDEEGEGATVERGPDAFKEGDVLVADFTTPDLELLMKKASAIVTNEGGRTCHAAIIAREFGKPAVVGTSALGRKATEALKPGQAVTVSTAEGPTGKIYLGAVPVEISTIDVTNLPRPKTKIQLIVGNPDLAWKHAMVPHDGVALLREEFLALNLGVHPLVVANYRILKEEEERLKAGIQEQLETLRKEIDHLAATAVDPSTRSALLASRLQVEGLLHTYTASEVHIVPRLRQLKDSLERLWYTLVGPKMQYPQREKAGIQEKFTALSREKQEDLDRLIDLEVVFEGDPVKGIEGLREKRKGHESAWEWYIRELARGLAKIARAFNGKPVKLRRSDLKSNEYRQLLGGTLYEPEEEQPMMGWRGASRYYDERYKLAFRLELEAIRYAMQNYGTVNLQPFFPMVRTPQELELCLDLVAEAGIDIKTHPVGMMVEVPSTALDIGAFMAVFTARGVTHPFISIGSNDLTQFTYALSRDDGVRVQGDPNELSPGVLRLIEMALTGARAAGCESGICGQGPSDKPLLVKYLVDWGITAVGVQPDSAIVALVLAAEAEGVQNIDPQLLAYAHRRAGISS